MLIFEIIPSFSPLGGAENFVLSLAERLSKKSKVIVISLYDSSDSYSREFLKRVGIQVFYLSKRKGVDLNCSKKLKKLIEKFKPDVCHLHLDSYLSLFLTGLLHKLKVYYTFHTFVSKETYGSKLKPKNIFLKYLLKNNKLVPIAISETVAVSIKDYFGIKWISVIRNGIDIQRFAATNKEKKFTFISIGSFNDIKNNMFMLKCFEEVSRRHKDISYIVIGNGKNYLSCINYCEAHNINNVLFTGQVHNVEKYLALSECLLLASHWEGNPLVVNEAIASGVFVIANNVGGVPDIVNETNGILASPESSESFCLCMEQYLANKQEFKNVVMSNLETNRQLVNIEMSSNSYLELFHGSDNKI